MEFLTDGIMALTWQQLVMYAVGITLIWLAIKKGFEPALLLPMGFGAILVNLPFSGVVNQTLTGGIQANGVIEWMFHVGIEASEVMPILLFIGIGAMIDFGPLLSGPSLFLFGAGAQFGIFAAILVAALLGFRLTDAASIGIIGAADGPTSILVSQVLGSRYIGAIAVAAYSYMALVPIVQPFAIRLVTTKKERCIHMDYNPKSVSKTIRIAFPIAVTMIVGLVAPQSVALVGFLMFGNLIRECGVLGTMSDTAQNISGKPDHPASWNHNLLQHACGSVRNQRHPADPGDRAFCLRNGYHRRSPSGQIYESFPEKKDQSHDRRCRNLSLPHVIKSNPENGNGRRSHQRDSHAGCRCQCIRTDCLSHSRRHGHQSGCFLQSGKHRNGCPYHHGKRHGRNLRRYPDHPPSGMDSQESQPLILL